MKLAAFSIGTAVRIGPQDDPISATVSAVCIRGVAHSMQYECVWWEGKTRKCEWVDEREVVAIDDKPVKMNIGYAGGVK